VDLRFAISDLRLNSEFVPAREIVNRKWLRASINRRMGGRQPRRKTHARPRAKPAAIPVK